MRRNIRRVVSLLTTFLASMILFSSLVPQARAQVFTDFTPKQPEI